MMRNLYIVLSGIIAGAAVLGWSQVCTEPAQNNAQPPMVAQNPQSAEPAPAVVQPVNEAQNQPAAAQPAPSYHWISPEKLNADLAEAIGKDHSDRIGDLVEFAISDKVQNLSTGSAPKAQAAIRLATPDQLPIIGDQVTIDVPPQVSPKDLFGVMKSDDRMKTAQTLAVVDIASHKVLAADNNKAAENMLERTFDAADSWALYVQDNQYKRTTWHCMDASLSTCIIADDVVFANIPEDQRCAAAQQAFVKFNENDAFIDTASLVRASNCPAQDKAISSALNALSDLSGSFDHNGKTYSYNKLQSDDLVDITLFSILPPESPANPQPDAQDQPPVQDQPDVQPQANQAQIIPAPTAAPVPATQDKASGQHFTPQSIILSILAALAVMLMGFFFTSPKKDEDELKKLKSDCDKAKKENNKLTKERDELKKKLALADNTTEKQKKTPAVTQPEAEKEKADAPSETSEAPKPEAAAKPEPTTESQDKADAGKSDLLETPTESDMQAASTPENAEDHADHELDDVLDSLGKPPSSTTLEKSSEKTDANRSTAQAPDQIEQLAEKDSVNAFFDAIDENWDEIADSFDAMMSPKSKKNAPIELKRSEKIDLTSGDDSVFGMSGFLTAIKQSDKRNNIQEPESPHTQTGLKSLRDTPKLDEMPVIEPKLSAHKAHSMISNEGNNNSTNLGMVPHTTMPLVKAIKPLGDAPDQQDDAVDQNSLYDALKRRARDVSEINGAQKLATSGAFEFNHGLSKSGLFSVTGSRVDIDPSSDNAYFKSLYEKFVATQAECGEPTDKMNLEQFISRLAREKDKLLKQYNCKDVKFSVYTKDGKASIKAVPQK